VWCAAVGFGAKVPVSEGKYVVKNFSKIVGGLSCFRDTADTASGVMRKSGNWQAGHQGAFLGSDADLSGKYP